MKRLHTQRLIRSAAASGLRCWAAAWLLACLSGCRGSDAPPGPVPAAPPTPAAAIQRITTKTGVETVLLPGGQFTLGSDSGEVDEQPAHRVQLSPFYLDITEVTQDSYQRLMGTNPSKWKAPERPVERVNWLQAVQYCNLRSQREGLQPCYDLTTFQCDFSADGYRLPTEAEWEYACRAGTTTAWSSGDSATDLEKHAWLKPSAANTTHPVRQKAPNAWGLYDMHGNVAEWCHDFYAEGYGGGEAVSDPRGRAEGEERVVRGGNFALSAQACRCSARASMAPAFADACFGAERQGFRCVRRAEAVKQP